ncbi:MAG: hypothetical protein CMH64_00170 [Nanoarchaeota archaeon]|nr:hypothetical protein [Nanoarchaeota archaeon]|tara:strand:+ start:4145 stop:4831 length:687 start_codon:yes stop_codon:yes gene_type:complete
MTDNWDNVWKKKKIVSDYSLKLYDFLRGYSEKLDKNSDVLEVGCGSGGGLAQFKDHNIVGLDTSEEALKLSKQYTDNLVNASMFDMPFEKEKFDLVYSSGLLEHFKIDKTREALMEISRVTKKTGEIIIIVPSSNCIWYRIFKKSMIMLNKWDFGYEEDYSIRKMKLLVKGTDLKIKKFFGLQALLPMSTNNVEVLSEKYRRLFVGIEKLFPFKQYYAYAVGMVLEKN